MQRNKMTEKRSDYRKKIKQKKSKRFFDTIKSAFDDDDEVDVNPEFTRDTEDQVVPQVNRENQGEHDSQRVQSNQNAKLKNAKNVREKQILSSEDKGLRLKRKLNHAILIVFVLIILVLLALFHL